MARCKLGRVKSGPRKGKCKKRKGKPWSTARKMRYGKTQKMGGGKTRRSRMTAKLQRTARFAGR